MTFSVIERWLSIDRERFLLGSSESSTDGVAKYPPDSPMLKGATKIGNANSENERLRIGKKKKRSKEIR